MCACTHQSNEGKTMSQAEMKGLAIAAAILFAAYKFGPAVVKGGAVAVAAVIVANRVPYVKDVL
jgi:urea transporter